MKKPSLRAVLMPNWLGDFVLALSVVLRDVRIDDSPIHLIVPEHLVDVGRSLCSLPIIPYCRKTARLRKESLDQVKNFSFKQIIIFPRSFSAALFALRCGIPNRRGIVGQLRRLMLTDPLPLRTASRTRHITDEYASLLDIDAQKPQMWLDSSQPAPIKRDAPIVLCPGALFGPAKKWQGFHELIELFQSDSFIVLGDHRDKADGERLAAVSPGRVENRCGLTTLAEAVKIIGNAKLVIANDSGLMHVAGFLGTPVVGIFGSTSPIWTRPLGNRVRIALTKEQCSPCFNRTCQFGHYSCLSSLKAATVAKLAGELL